MRKAMIGLSAVLTIGLVAWASSDPWKDKPYQQWDQKDIQHILTSSPWSKTVSVEAKGQANESQVPQSSPTAAQSAPSNSSGDSSGGAIGNGPRPGGMSGGSAPASSGGIGGYPSASGAPEIAFSVRWLSSRTMREALVRNAVMSGSMTQADADKDLAQPVDAYQVFIAGSQMAPFEPLDETSIKQGATLTTKKTKQKIEAEKVEIQRSPDGKTIRGIVIWFPKKTATGEVTIGPDEKGAEFAFAGGSVSIKMSFDFSKMYDAQGRDL